MTQNEAVERPGLSVCLIIKNEEAFLRGCLESIKTIADEIIIVDSGSTDKSLDIAEDYKAKVFHHHDWQGYGKQRIIAQSYASCDYILVLDADERPDQTLINAIKAEIEKPAGAHSIFAMSRRNLFCGKDINWLFNNHHMITRLYSRQHFAYHPRYVHESVDSNNQQVTTLDGTLDHYMCTNIEHFMGKHLRYAKDWARSRNKYGLKKALGSALVAFIKEWLIRGGIASGAYGFIYAATLASCSFNKYLIGDPDLRDKLPTNK